MCIRDRFTNWRVHITNVETLIGNLPHENRKTDLSTCPLAISNNDYRIKKVRLGLKVAVRKEFSGLVAFIIIN